MAMKLTSAATSPCTSASAFVIVLCSPQLTRAIYSAWQHFGCTPTTRVAQLVQSYDEAKAVEGWSELKSGEQEKVQRAWEEGAIPEEDKGPGEPIEAEPKKKAAAPRKKKADDQEGSRPKKRAKKAKVGRLS